MSFWEIFLQCVIWIGLSYIIIKRFLYNCFILQLEHYHLFQFMDWFYKNKTNKKLLVTLGLSIVGLVFILFIPFSRVNYYEIIVVLLMIPFVQFKQDKKKLAYTHRMIRLFIFSFVVVGIIFILTYILFHTRYSLNKIILFNLLLDNFIIFDIAILGQLLCLPLEKYYQNKFIVKAKSKLLNHQNLKVIGITGSYGKTSIKFIVGGLLKKEFNVCMTPNSYNTPMGVTITVNNYLKNIDEYFICEMGACRTGEIKTLCDIVYPQIGILSSIGPQHLETFRNIRNIINTKFELIESLPKNGLGILNYDNYYIRNYKVKNDVKIITYGLEQSDVDYYALNIHFDTNGSTFEVQFPNQNRYLFKTKLLGKHNISNILAGIALADYMQISPQKIIYAVEQLAPITHRLELKHFKNYNIIDDSFNANVEGSSNALDILNHFPDKHVIITPGMIELGSAYYEQNYRFGEKIAKVCNYVVLVGKKQTKPIYNALIDIQYPKENIFVTNSFNEGFQHVLSRFTDHFTVLIENDLPDNYNES